jgi:hypothetical protein
VVCLLVVAVPALYIGLKRQVSIRKEETIKTVSRWDAGRFEPIKRRLRLLLSAGFLLYCGALLWLFSGGAE